MFFCTDRSIQVGSGQLPMIDDFPMGISYLFPSNRPTKRCSHSDEECAEQVIALTPGTGGKHEALPDFIQLERPGSAAALW